jgi:arylsulfatase A-like enzyme
MVIDRLNTVLARAIATIPALLAALICVRIVEAGHGVAGGTSLWGILLPTIVNDVLAFARYAFLLVLLALPLGLIAHERARAVAAGVLWSIVVLAYGALIQYSWSAGVPLGADLFAYSTAEISTTVAGTRPSQWIVGGLALGLAILWRLLLVRSRTPRVGYKATLLFMVLSLACFALAPEQLQPPGQGINSALISQNKATFFFDSNVKRWRDKSSIAIVRPDGSKPDAATWSGPDSRYPFLRAERTPDTLGIHFKPTSDGKAPNFVFIVVEGLGRNFSGTTARFGSFTPFLDELAQRSLYFENFVAPQGRTFGVLPSLFASLPFGDGGFSALGEAMPQVATLPGILKAQGYQLRYYIGSNLAFDNQGLFLKRAGVDQLISEPDYGAEQPRFSEWGVADGSLVDMALAREKQAPAGQFLSIVQTNTMHTPFDFPDKARYQKLAEQRVAELGIPADKRQLYEEHRDIFASVLYTDTALRRFFEQAQALPGYANTIFIVTGDHRLPELPMDTRIERYHVPLIVFSPLLKAPLSIKSVSSQFDIAPSLLAYLGKQYAITSPAQVTWQGTGLDLEPQFRNVHAFAMKQTKTDLVDFLSGTAYLAQDRLYSLADGMHTDLMENPGVLAKARAQFSSYKAANGQFTREKVLAPAAIPLSPFSDSGRSLTWPSLAAEPPSIDVTNTTASAANGELVVVARFANRAQVPSPPVVPLLVLLDLKGRQVGEASGAAITLAPYGAQQVALRFKTAQLAKGDYLVAMIPSHPDTGKPIGAGQYHVPVRL